MILWMTKCVALRVYRYSSRQICNDYSDSAVFGLICFCGSAYSMQGIINARKSVMQHSIGRKLGNAIWDMYKNWLWDLHLFVFAILEHSSWKMVHKIPLIFPFLFILTIFQKFTEI